LYRQSSSEAFYLADAAVEHARVKFLADRSWWLPPNSPTFTDTLGRGRCDLTVTQFGTGDSVDLVADGFVQNAHRRIEVRAKVPPTGFDIPLFVGAT